jgi:hypothetical protein
MTPTWMVLATGSKPGAAERVLLDVVVLLLPPQAAAARATAPRTAISFTTPDLRTEVPLVVTVSIREGPGL